MLTIFDTTERQVERADLNGAWTEVAFELLSLGAPEWTLGRLCRIDGEWLCTLTRHPDVPHWLDDSIELKHRSMNFALLEALQRRSAAGAPARQAQSADRVLDGSDYR